MVIRHLSGMQNYNYGKGNLSMRNTVQLLEILIRTLRRNGCKDM